MDFMFNFTTDNTPPIKINEPKTKPVGIQKKFNTNSSNFQFNFSKNDKIKALVVKKRKNEIYNIKKGKEKVDNDSQPINYVSKQDDSSESSDHNADVPRKINYVMAPKYMNDIDEFASGLDFDEKPHIIQNETNTNGTESDSLSVQHHKNSNQRKEHNFNRKNKVLTEEEIKEGIKKFSKPQGKVRKEKRQLIRNNLETKIIGQRLIKPIVEKVFTGCSLDTLNIHPHIVKDLKDLLNITELTTVQQKCIPKALEGHNILVRSQTGSGKTLAYALPIVQKLQEIRPKITRNCGIMALVIVPTRELALQTYECFVKLLKPFTFIVPGYLCGGEKRKSEKARLRKGINILIGTTGRLLDHFVHTDCCKLDKLRFFVVDEADRLFELDYEKEVAKIIHTIEEHKANAKVADEFRVTKSDAVNNQEEDIPIQRFLLSATLTPGVQKLAGLTLKNPIFIDNSDETVLNGDSEVKTEYENAIEQAVKEDTLVLPETLSLSYIVVHPKLRLVTLSAILAKQFNKTSAKVLVFMATTEMVNFHHDILNEVLTQHVLDEEEEIHEDEDDGNALLVGVKFFKLHGALTQIERSAVFKAFKTCKSGILLTTDVAGRGIDVPEVDLVIQYSPPPTLFDFVHRVGRTARAGKSGQAIIFLAENEVEFIKLLEDKRVRISQEILEKNLKILKDFDTEAHSVQEACSNLQHKFEDLVEDDKEMYTKACKACTSWMRNYAAFPKEFKPIFNIKKAHKGHFAKSFALKDPPTKFASRFYAPKPQKRPNELSRETKNNSNKPMGLDERKRKHNLTSTVSGGQRVVNSYSSSKSNKIQRNNTKQKAGAKLAEFAKRSVMMSLSEFDSGIPSKKLKT